MINELIDQIGGRDGVEDMAEGNWPDSGFYDNVKLMARALLAVLDAKPVGITDNAEVECLLRGEMANVMPPNYRGVDKGDEVYIYTVPQAASSPDGWKLVPIEPTQRMIDAHTEGMVSGGATRAYRAMLAAAPAPGDKK